MLLIYPPWINNLQTYTLVKKVKSTGSYYYVITPAERRLIRPKACTMGDMIRLKTRKSVFDDSLGKDEKQPDAIIELQNSIKTTCSSNGSKEKLEDEGRPSFVVAERVNH